MTVGKGKRPRDPNQLAKWIVDRSTENKREEFIVPTKTVAPIDPSAYMAEVRRKGGQIGGSVGSRFRPTNSGGKWPPRLRKSVGPTM